jgi:hypothetical protein
MPPELGWESLELFHAKVAPRLRADGLLSDDGPHSRE